MTIRILLVDDHVVVRQGLVMLLAAYEDMEVVGEAGDGAEAVHMAQQLHPDVILMDLLLPVLDGIEATRQIRASGIPCTILVLTATIESYQIRKAIRAGAHSYILKTTRAQELVDAIRSTLKGLRTLDPIATHALLDGLAQKDELDELTPRECEVLRSLALGHTNAQIARDLVVTEATVRSHIANVFSKLNLQNRTQATLFALKHGLISLNEVN